MSNHRKPPAANTYRIRYLRSPQWFGRRDRWFAHERRLRGIVRCALCLSEGNENTLELHHLDYLGVTQTPSGWAAREPHDDLTALHPRCHEWVHKLIDRDRALSGLLSRRTASVQAITRLRSRIVQTLTDREDL